MSIYSEPKYCVYLTSYRGNKLPQFYIGSTLLSKIDKGYRGSIKSKAYKEIFAKEKAENPQLFTTKIIAKYHSRKYAQFKEAQLQKTLNVVKSEMYMNMSIAKNFGWFGMNTKKEQSPVYGKRWTKTEEQRLRAAEACKKAFNKLEHKQKMSKIRKGKLPLSKEKKQELINLYKSVFALYNSRPEINYNYIAKNGKLITYERAFAKEFCSTFGKTSNGLHMILTKPLIAKEYL